MLKNNTGDNMSTALADTVGTINEALRETIEILMEHDKELAKKLVGALEKTGEYKTKHRDLSLMNI